MSSTTQDTSNEMEDLLYTLAKSNLVNDLSLYTKQDLLKFYANPRQTVSFMSVDYSVNLTEEQINSAIHDHWYDTIDLDRESLSPYELTTTLSQLVASEINDIAEPQDPYITADNIIIRKIVVYGYKYE